MIESPSDRLPSTRRALSSASVRASDESCSLTVSDSLHYDTQSKTYSSEDLFCERGPTPLFEQLLDALAVVADPSDAFPSSPSLKGEHKSSPLVLSVEVVDPGHCSAAERLARLWAAVEEADLARLADVALAGESRAT